MMKRLVALLFVLIGAVLYVGGLVGVGAVSGGSGLAVVLFTALIGGIILAPAIVLAVE